ncbi:MAG: Ig-like domain-containing protein [Desulfurococcales archaeon]|nr:Ig-like domain-containing protein [Desulfurococcales archaeon]
MGIRLGPLLLAAMILLATIPADLVPLLYPAGASGLTVTGTQVIENQTVHVSGSVVVEPGGTLRLRNATLVINESSNCQYSITVKEGGTLILEGGSKITTNSSQGYQILVNGTLNVTDSTLEYLGGCNPGILARGPSPLLYFKNALIKYTGSSINVIQVSGDEDSDPTTLARLEVHGLRFQSLTGYAIYNLFYISGDTVFNINRLDTSHPSVSISSYDVNVNYGNNARSNATTLYIRNSWIHKLYYRADNKATDLEITNLTVESYTDINGFQWSDHTNATITRSELNGTVKLTYLNAHISSTRFGNGRLEVRDCNLTMDSVNITNPQASLGDPFKITQSLYVTSTIDINRLLIEGVANSGTYLRNGIYIYSESIPSRTASRITIANLQIQPAPGEKVVGVYIDKNSGTPITIRDSKLPGIAFGYYRDASYNSMNLYLDNVTTLDNKPIVIIRDANGVTVTGSYGQVLIYNSSNIVVDGVSFTTGVPGPIAVSHSDSITIRGVTITRDSYLYGIKVFDARTVSIEDVTVNGSITFPKLLGVEVNNATVHIRDSRLEGSRLINIDYGGSVTVNNSTLRSTDPDVLVKAISLVRHSNLWINGSVVESEAVTIYSWIPSSTESACDNVTVTYSRLESSQKVIDVAYHGEVRILHSSISRRAGSTSTDSLLRFYPSWGSRDLIIRGSNITNNGVEVGSLIYTTGSYNMHIEDNRIIGPGKMGIDISFFSNSSGVEAVIARNTFEGQTISIHIANSIGVQAVNNTIYSRPGYPGGILIDGVSYSYLDRARHAITGNTIDGKPIVYVYDATTTITSASQVIALNARVTINGLTMDSRPGLIQAYTSKITINNSVINVRDYLSRADSYGYYPVIRDWLDSHIEFVNSRIESNSQYVTVIYLSSSSDNEDHSTLVFNGANITGSAYRFLYSSRTSSLPRLYISNSIITINGTNPTLNNFYLAFIDQLEIRDTEINTTVYNVLDIDDGNRVLMKNVSVHSPQPGTIITNYAFDLRSIYSLTLSRVEFIDTRGIYLVDTHVFYAREMNISTSDRGAGALFTIWSSDTVFDQPRITHTKDTILDVRSGTTNVISPILDETTWTNTDPVSGWAVFQANGGNLRIAGLNATGIGGEPLRITGGTLTVHESVVSRNPGYGLTVRGGTANVTDNYWGGSDGPNVTTLGADATDPEEIYYSSGIGSLTYSPYLGAPPSDSTPPAINVTAPSDGVDVRGLIDVNFTYSDDYGVMVVMVFLNDSIAGVAYPPAGTVGVDTSKFPDGYYNLRVVALDWAGNRAERVIGINVKNYHPSARILEPENGALVSGRVDVRVYVYDDNLKNWTLKVDGTSIWSGYTTGYFTVSWDSSRVADGSHTLTLEAWDLDGNYDSDSITLTVDNTAPALTVTGPANNSVVSGDLSLGFTASEVHPDSYMVYLNGTLIEQGALSSGTHTITVATTDYADGTYNITIIANDTAGNRASEWRIYKFDNTRPSVSITEPSDGDQVAGTVTITVDASDANGIAWVAIYINGTLVSNQTGPGPYTYDWNTTREPPGSYTIQAVAADPAGNTKTDSVNVLVNPTPVPEPGYTPLAALLAIATLLVAYTRRKRP